MLKQHQTEHQIERNIACSGERLCSISKGNEHDRKVDCCGKGLVK
jgi:hypothetical protein